VLHDPNYTPLFGSDPPPARKKDDGVFEKFNSAVAAANENARKARTVQPSTLTNKTSPARTATPEPPRRVMIGGADRIENLWPRSP
jgi:hypothetical protein